MGKHRELAKELYSSRIWRTVVVAGAMLAAPATAAADKAPAPAPTQAANPPAKPAPAPPAAGGGGAAAGAPAVVAVPPKPDAITLRAQQIEAFNKERNEMLAKLNSVEPKELDRLKKDIDVKDAAIKKLVTELVNLRKPRPRTPPEVRPVGRGFVLA